jgi:hypothetical protein
VQRSRFTHADPNRLLAVRRYYTRADEPGRG